MSIRGPDFGCHSRQLVSFVALNVGQNHHRGGERQAFGQLESEETANKDDSNEDAEGDAPTAATN